MNTGYIAVIGHHREFNHFIHQLNRRDWPKLVHVCRIIDVRGWKFDSAIRLENAHLLEDYQHIVDLIRATSQIIIEE